MFTLNRALIMEPRASQEVTTLLLADPRPKEKAEPARVEEVNRKRQVQEGLSMNNVLELRSVPDSPLAQLCSSVAPGGV